MVVKRAVVSVYDKTGVAEFCRELHKLGVEILSTGGTAKELQRAGIPVTEISNFTGSPEVFEGRVKTLHPKVHGGILYKRKEHAKEAKEQGIEPIDMVVVNLYPFEKTIAKKGASEQEIIENIDIGGPAMIRSAAKNFESVAVVVDPSDYEALIQELKENKDFSPAMRRRLMEKAFARTAEYDWAISSHFGKHEGFPLMYELRFKQEFSLRYGENPHQHATAYSLLGSTSILHAPVHSDEKMSYNNYLDADAAFGLIMEFMGENACAIIKHTNPCGGALGKTLKDAYERALQTDPLSAFGGIIAFGKKVDKATAESIGDKFVEVIVAPGYDEDAMQILRKKPKRRIIDISSLVGTKEKLNYRWVFGGLLSQEKDSVIFNRDSLRAVSKKKPTEREINDLEFATRFVKHTKSNALIIAKDLQVLGIGAGQMSRVDSCKTSISKAKEAKFDLKGSVVSSDAFLPFRDTLDEYAKVGVSALLEPGGSIRDVEIIHAADEHEMGLVFSGFRHFKH
ncbi:MAG: bifunctional phosphoribosylaminoimidazolecarboxamide formyltransferase/IMP cyclohydrolase [Candidatus Micrarchaeota archaeon]